ncbi:MAG TPA: BrnT family toxin [Polyangiaceae bacterium]|nr:BrnT family toxin [Polyangiaceae bacterium]
MRIVWDEAKNRENQRKHGLSFQEARALLVSGVDHLEIFDEEHSELEDRFVSIGPIARGIVLVVWTERDEKTTRIISARFATKREAALYRRYMGKKK